MKKTMEKRVRNFKFSRSVASKVSRGVADLRGFLGTKAAGKGALELKKRGMVEDENEWLSR
jgi:hypothetical protein